MDTRFMNAPSIEILKELKRRDAAERFSDFIGYTMPFYEFGWFNDLLAMQIEKFYEDYEAGKNPRLMIFAPPRSGKSEQASRRAPAWFLGQDPKLEIISTSYSADLSLRMSRDTKRIIMDRSYKEVFPDTRIKEKGESYPEKVEGGDELWETVDAEGRRHGGSYRSSGVGGGITGQGFQIGIIDDPVKDYAEASSPAYQKKVWEWYQTTFLTRRNPRKNGIILIMTRWHKQDLAGKLLEEMKNGGDQWTVVNFPMVCEQAVETYRIGNKMYRTREKGDVLHAERMSPEFVEECKRSGDLVWSALYQQRPNIAGGNFFKTEFWDWYDPQNPPKFTRKIITVDTAQKKGEHNDYTVFQLWGLSQGKIYLIDQFRKKLEAHELRHEAVKFWRMYGGGITGSVVKASAFYIEDKSSGTGLIQELRAGGYDKDGNRYDPIPCIAIPRETSKQIRANDKQPTIASGLLVLPRNALWLNEFLMEFEDFTLDDTHEHDDQVDPAMDAIDILLKGSGGLPYGAMNAA